MLGAKPVERAFRLLPKTVARKVVVQAMRKAMKPIASQVKINAPIRTGATVTAVKVKAAKRSRKGFGIDVRIGEGDFKGDQFYAAMVEYGTKDRRKKSTGQHVGKVKPRRFMRRAFRQKADMARRIASNEIGRGILREAKALKSAGETTPK